MIQCPECVWQTHSLLGHESEEYALAKHFWTAHLKKQKNWRRVRRCFHCEENMELQPFQYHCIRHGGFLALYNDHYNGVKT